MFTRFHAIALGGFLVAGALVVATVLAAAPAETAGKNCCDLKLACCSNGGSACCAASDKLGCCDKGLDCCKNNQGCCKATQPCCDKGEACCDEGKACCGPKGTKLTAATGEAACCSTASAAKLAKSCCTGDGNCCANPQPCCLTGEDCCFPGAVCCTAASK